MMSTVVQSKMADGQSGSGRLGTLCIPYYDVDCSAKQDGRWTIRLEFKPKNTQFALAMLYYFLSNVPGRDSII